MRILVAGDFAPYRRIEEMIESNSKDFNTAKIRFSTNFSTLRHVYIIENLHQAEIDSLITNPNEQ